MSFEVDVDSDVIETGVLPRRAQYEYRYEDPSTIRKYLTSFLPLSRRLLRSGDGLATELTGGASPLGCFIASIASSLPPRAGWTKERLQPFPVRSHGYENDLTREYRGEVDFYDECRDDRVWEAYQMRRADRDYWSQALRCSFDWSWYLPSLNAEELLIMSSDVRNNE